MTFEEALKELEETVTRLEGGETTLEEALALFEKGVTLTKNCRKMLDEAQLKVKKVTEEGCEDFTKGAE
ncbi:MAG: exodeoxyribonuclease VII small subunit [Clostridia bacterium]|nr:exodeoxyribonuclease VII small subunit [Clostridia bacterium]